MLVISKPEFKVEWVNLALFKVNKCPIECNFNKVPTVLCEKQEKNLVPRFIVYVLPIFALFEYTAWHFIHQQRKTFLFSGLNIGIKIYFPTHCGGDGLCDFLNSYFASRGSVGVMVKGNLSQSEMTCEWKTTDIIVSRNLQLHNVVFRIFGGYIIRKILIATFEFKLYNFAMKGKKVSSLCCPLLNDGLDLLYNYLRSSVLALKR